MFLARVNYKRHFYTDLGFGSKEATTFFLYKFYLFIYLFLPALGLRCCVRAFSSCGERGQLLVVAHRLLIVVASLVAEYGL